MVEEKKSATQALIVNIGQEKAVVDEAVESSKGDEEEASTLSVRPRLICSCTDCETVVANSTRAQWLKTSSYDNILQVSSVMFYVNTTKKLVSQRSLIY